jgi:hypothetical protein
MRHLAGGSIELLCNNAAASGDVMNKLDRKRDARPKASASSFRFTDNPSK